MTDLPDLLQLTEVGEHRYNVFQPATAAEGRDVVFSGQLLAQMLMASEVAGGGTKDVRSVHAIFARAGRYGAPIELEVESMQNGRTWASDTITATQEGRLLCRAMVLLNSLDDDLVRHEPSMPSVAGPADLEDGWGQSFPGAGLRPVPGEVEVDGVPSDAVWHRFERPLDSQAANQAILAWATCGGLIGLAMRPHQDTVRIQDAHASVSAGVIAHTMHFLERVDVSQWLLVQQVATKAANGRVHGRGAVFAEDGTLVATFNQDSMLKAAATPIDGQRGM